MNTEKNVKKFKVGFNNSEKDARDWNYNSIYLKYKKKINVDESHIDYRNILPPATDQIDQGSCVAHCIACIKEFHEYIEIKCNKDSISTYPKNINGRIMSSQFIYNMRDIEGDHGMYPKKALQEIKKHGVCYESEFPYGSDTKKFDIDFIEVFSKNKEMFKIKNYTKITGIDECKAALIMDGPCLIGLLIYHFDDDNYIWKPNKYNMNIIGGHALTIVGYNKDGFILRNSWGKNWGDNGHCILPYSDWDYVLKNGERGEVWTVVDIENDKPIYENISDDIVVVIKDLDDDLEDIDLNDGDIKDTESNNGEDMVETGSDNGEDNSNIIVDDNSNEILDEDNSSNRCPIYCTII